MWNLKRRRDPADTSFEGSMPDTPERPISEPPQNLLPSEGFVPAPSQPGPPLQSFGVNASAELVADLVAATGLLGPDRLAQVRSRAAQTRGSFAQALLNEGLASGGGVARLLAARHQLQFIELSFTGVDAKASKLLPLHVLERAPAL